MVAELGHVSLKGQKNTYLAKLGLLSVTINVFEKDYKRVVVETYENCST